MKLKSAIVAVFALFLACQHAFAAATLLPNGEQCFAANSPTSGGIFGPVTTLGTISGGSSYVNGTYTNVPLTGGSGFGAAATIVVVGNAVNSVSVTNAGSHYAAGDTLAAANTSLGGAGVGFSVPVSAVSSTGTGMVGLLGTITGGTGGTAGTYAGVSLTGGSGSNATANITVSGGAVTAVAILNPGRGYQVGDTLSASSGSIGSVSGFSVGVSSVTINQALAGGQVYFYQPGTQVFKSTWFNADQASTHQNTNPVILDQNGCAIIYGTGTYRQVLQDSMGNTVWDQATTDTSANNNTFWAGIAGGTPNAITVTDPGFNATDGSIINFTALSTNTGSATLNPSGFGAIPILKNTTAGPVSLTGGEIVQGNPISVIYSAVNNAFNLLNTAIQSASGASAPLCGAVGLKITNGASPNITINLTADQIVMQTPSGLIINRSNVSFTINVTTGNVTSTANGMDGEAVPSSGTVYIWAIDNGAASAGLGSSSSSAPTMPSGYNYKCRLGAMTTDGTPNLRRTIQVGNFAQYNGSNSGAEFLTAGSAGASCGSATPTYATVSYGALLPATATQVRVLGVGNINGAGAATVAAAPNTSYSGVVGSAPPPVFVGGATQPMAYGQWVVESASFAYCSSGAAGGLSLIGWQDKVNAQ